MCLLYGIYGVAIGLQCLDRINRLLKIAPVHGEFSTECCLVNLVVGWAAAYTAEPYALQAKSIGGTEGSPYIVLAADIVKYHNEGHFLRFMECLWREAVHLLYSRFLHTLFFGEKEWQTNGNPLFVWFDI